VSQSAIAKLEREGCNPTVETLDRTLRAAGFRLQLIAPAWSTATGEPGPSIDESLIRQALERSPAERIKSVETDAHGDAPPADRSRPITRTCSLS